MAGRFFGFGKKKPTTKLKNQSQLSTDDADSDSDDAYQDSDKNCPTEPPRGLIPNYPPPRPGSPRSNPKQQPTVRRDDYQDPWDSTSNKPVFNKNGAGMSSLSTYADPFDSTQNTPSINPKPVKNNNVSHTQTDYEDPFDSKFVNDLKNHKGGEEHESDDESYDTPYETTTNVTTKYTVGGGNTDTYEDPWDTKNKNKDNIIRSNTTNTFEIKSNKTQKIAIDPPISRSKKDDYKDPWDTKTSSSLKSMDGYDDTYSEPYDKDKTTVLDEKKRKSQIEDELEEDDLYDFPYEEKVAIGIAPPSTVTNGREGSRNFHSLPASARNTYKHPPPPRPAPTAQIPSNAPTADDYDAPWEWKVQKVEQEFEKKFSVTDPPIIGQLNQERLSITPTPRKPSSATPAEKPAIRNPAINPVPKPVRTSRTDDVFATALYEVDPTIPLDNQGWFHGAIRRGEAENLLRNQQDCSYLIRNSESSKLDYSLSLRNKNETMHLKISCRKNDGKYILGVNSRPYDTIPEMIHHYSRNKLNIRGAEHVKLEYPVFSEAMYFTVEPGS